MAKRKTKAELGIVYTSKQMMEAIFPSYGFTGLLKTVLGDVTVGGSAVFHGESGNGKSTLVASICMELQMLGPLYYNNVESGVSGVIQKLGRRLGVNADTNITWGHRNSFQQMKYRLKTTRSKFAVLDSIQSARLTFAQSQELIKEFPKVFFLFIAWGDGKLPIGKPAQDILFESDIKVLVDAGVAYINSRFEADPFYYIPGVYEYHQAQKIAQIQADKALKHALRTPKAQLALPFKAESESTFNN